MIQKEFVRSALSFSISSILLVLSNQAVAQIISDPKASTAQKPVITVAHNAANQAVPVVQIRTPQDGISHNKYSQFDVSALGAVLNNARSNANTQTVGQITANPFLRQGEAHTIINEVNSARASHLAGNIEVAGQKANVIIANPSGIHVSGAGFINVHEATLSTGNLSVNQGEITHHIKQGKIDISNKSGNQAHLGIGGNHNQADYVNLYAQAVELNAQVHANARITSITGNNQIDEFANVQKSSPQTASTTSAVALDVKQLGGMYANSIHLIGTQEGFGVRNAGTIHANSHLVVTQDGKIENKGTIQASQGIIAKSKQELINQGEIKSDKGLIQLNAPTLGLQANLTAQQDIWYCSKTIPNL